MQGLTSDTPIDRRAVEEFKNKMRIGQSYRIAVEEIAEQDPLKKGKLKVWRKKIVQVKAKYPFIVDTDAGTFQYAELLQAVRRYEDKIWQRL